MVEEKQSPTGTQETDDMPVTEAHDILYRALGIGREILIAYPGPAQREATLEELTLISTTPAARATPAGRTPGPPGPPTSRTRRNDRRDGVGPVGEGLRKPRPHPHRVRRAETVRRAGQAKFVPSC